MPKVCNISSAFVVLLVSIGASAQNLTVYPVYTGQDSVIVVPASPSDGFTGSVSLQTDCTTGSAQIPLDPQPSPIAAGSSSPVRLTPKDKKTLAKGASVCVLEAFAAKDQTNKAAIPATISSGLVEVADKPAIKITKASAGDKTIVVVPIPPGPYTTTVDVYSNCPPLLVNPTSLIDNQSSTSVDTNADPLTLTLQVPLAPVGGKICAVEKYKSNSNTDGLGTTPSQDISDAFVITDSSDIPPPGYDWGLVRAYFTAGALLSQQDDQFSHADMFLSFRLDKTYVQTKNLDSSGPHSFQPGFNAFFEPRLTALPVAVQPCNSSSSTTCSNANSNSSSSNNTDVFLNSQKSARLVFGVYAPFLINRWSARGRTPNGTIEDRPYALYIAPIAKTGFDTSLNGLNQTQQQGNTPDAVKPVGNSGSFYKFAEFGFRLGHYGLSKDKNVANDQISFLEVGWGRFSNMPSLLCPAKSGCPTTASSTPLPYARDLRLHVEGLLEVPATGGFSVGFSTNVAAKGQGPSNIGGTSYIHVRPPDDLRFFFGYKFDISAMAAKLAKK